MCYPYSEGHVAPLDSTHRAELQRHPVEAFPQVTLVKLLYQLLCLYTNVGTTPLPYLHTTNHGGYEGSTSTRDPRPYNQHATLHHNRSRALLEGTQRLAAHRDQRHQLGRVGQKRT